MVHPFLSLVGAGPGDPELITLKAINTIRLADVILHDALANESLLAYAAPTAKIQFVGKRKGEHSMTQEEINQLIVQYALEFGHVVRLKGGDPFVFGRATEEIEAAKKAGIPFVVIPGITSAIAVPAAELIPVTSRGIAESFWVITGTNQAGELSADLQLAVQSNATIVLLMAVGKLAEIVQLYLQHHKSNTPIAIIQNGTKQHKKKVVGTISNILDLAEAASIAHPAVIVIGQVVALNLDVSIDLITDIPSTKA